LSRNVTKPVLYITSKVMGSSPERVAEAFDVRYRNDPVPAPRDELLKNAREADALMCYVDDKIDAELMDACRSLKVVANIAVGYDNIDVGEATRRGVLITNTPGVLTNATADLALGLLLAVARRVVESDRFVRNGKWTGFTADLMIGKELNGKTLGIIGMGRIGEATAKRAAAFGMKIVYTRRGDNSEEEARLEKEHGAMLVSLDDLLKNADFVSVHCPLNDETRHLLGKKEFAQMKYTCVFINTARGAIVDQEALVEALRTRQIGGAGLDVFEGEPAVPEQLLSMSNVVLAPHIGSATFEARSAMADLASAGLLSAFSGKLPDNAVNKDVWNASPLAVVQTARD
jgi:glyoxylate reductase